LKKALLGAVATPDQLVNSTVRAVRIERPRGLNLASRTWEIIEIGGLEACDSFLDGVES
jgi:hypothetical protein